VSATCDLVADIAEQACAAHANGKTSVVIGGVTFNLVERGYCARFVRQCHEVAMGIPPFAWKYAAPNALEMEKNLFSMGNVASPVRGDIMCLNKNNGKFGHIGIYAGGGYLYENTSSTVRGPGTVRSEITAGMYAKLTRYYHVLPKVVVDMVQPWAREAVDWAIGKGLTDGTDLSFDVQRMLVILYRLEKGRT
jgi:hypothetical protein